MGSTTIKEKEQRKEQRKVVSAKVVSAKRTPAGYAIGIKIKSGIQYFFHETYIQPGNVVYIKLPECQLLQK